MIAVGSAFRDSAHYAEEYAARIAALAGELAQRGEGVRVIAAAGDCSDNTIPVLARSFRKRGLSLAFVPCDHGGRRFGSTEEVDRMEALTKVGNAILSGVREDDDMLFYVESDLRWDAATAVALLDIAKAADCIVAPLVFAGELFYDVWGFRDLSGGRFSPFPPYSSAIIPGGGGLVEVESVGSCLAMPAAIARSVQMPQGGCLVGFCQEARRAGHHVAVAPWLRVAHPC